MVCLAFYLSNYHFLHPQKKSLSLSLSLSLCLVKSFFISSFLSGLLFVLSLLSLFFFLPLTSLSVLSSPYAFPSFTFIFVPAFLFSSHSNHRSSSLYLASLKKNNSVPVHSFSTPPLSLSLSLSLSFLSLSLLFLSLSLSLPYFHFISISIS